MEHPQGTTLCWHCKTLQAMSTKCSCNLTRMAWHNHACPSLPHILKHLLGWPHWSQSHHNLPCPCQQKQTLSSGAPTPRSVKQFPPDDNHQNHPQKPPLCCNQAYVLGWHQRHPPGPNMLLHPCNFPLALPYVWSHIPPRNCQQTQNHATMGLNMPFAMLVERFLECQ